MRPPIMISELPAAVVVRLTRCRTGPREERGRGMGRDEGQVKGEEEGRQKKLIEVGRQDDRKSELKEEERQGTG